MISKHKNPTNKNRIAWAPYNFVPLPDRPFTAVDSGEGILNPAQNTYDQQMRRTGWIDVKLETKSPVFVRGPLTSAEHVKRQHEDENTDDRTPHLQKLRNKPDFFHNGDPNQPIIPGSSLRGMIRNVVEILGHGKFGPVLDRPLVYRAVGDTSSHGDAYRKQLMDEDPGENKRLTPKFKAGFIREWKGDWYIQPALERNNATYARISHELIRQCGDLTRLAGTRNASEIYCSVGDYGLQEVRGDHVRVRHLKVIQASARPSEGLEPMILAKSGHIPKKATEAAIFKPDLESDDDGSWIRIPDGNDPYDKRDLLAQYRDQLTPAQEKLLGRGGVLRDKQPVFYLMENDRLVFFGHTQMFRLTYKRSPQEFLPILYTDEGRIDLAEAMFGKVHSNQGGQAGRIFISDATLENVPPQADLWLAGGEVIPNILSEPKPTTFQHYLTQSKPDIPQGKGLETYNDNPATTTLRGYKRYWHKGNVSREQIAEKPENVRGAEQEKQHTRMKPVRDGVTFHFRIRFENLLPQELGLLWWAVALPVGDGGDYCHQIGMGKPLGLGGVKLTPELHLVQPSTRYSRLFTADGNNWESGEMDAGDAATDLKISVEQFESLMAKSQGQPGTPFAQLERVRMLLEMMRWREATPEWLESTRYMEIERRTPDGRKENEYKSRPVLPDPLHVK